VETIQKDPSAVLDFGFDWSAWLVDDTISASTWAVPSGLIKDSDSATTTTTTVWLSDGTAGSVYIVTNEIETAGGRTDQRSFRVQVVDR